MFELFITTFCGSSSYHRPHILTAFHEWPCFLYSPSNILFSTPIIVAKKVNAAENPVHVALPSTKAVYASSTDFPELYAL